MVNYPIEYTALRLLDTMQKQERGKIFTLYQLRKLVEKDQRRDRIRRIITAFKEMGWVRDSPEGGFMLTEEGRRACPWKDEYFELSWRLRPYQLEKL